MRDDSDDKNFVFKLLSSQGSSESIYRLTQKAKNLLITILKEKVHKNFHRKIQNGMNTNAITQTRDINNNK